MEIITSFFFQMIFTVGVIFLFGLLIALCRRAFCSVVGGDLGTKILLVTGIIGTPIHELSHALMCLIFGHRIEEIKLYDPDSDTGTMGYVSHSCNERNIYHQIGQFFIGIAPILGGSGVILLLMLIFTPDVHAEVMDEFLFIGLLPTDLFDPSMYTGFIGIFWDVVCDIFNPLSHIFIASE